MREKIISDRILTDAYSFPSARILRDAISSIIDRKIIITRDPERVKRKLVLRYGNSGAVNCEDTEYNCRDFIRLCSNKLMFSNLLRENGIKSPEFFNAGEPENYPVLIRKTLSSSGGRGIVLCENEEVFKENWRFGYYWTPFYPTEYEARAHIVGGELSRLFIKERDENLDKEKFPIRNLHRGYHFSIRNTENKYSKLKELVSKLGQILNGKFYALDIAYDGNEYIVWEANSAPGLNENTATEYAKFIAKEVYGVVKEENNANSI